MSFMPYCLAKNVHNIYLPEHLQVVGVTKRYGGVHALRDATFTLRSGEIHALMGENGAGKSTLARIIAGSTPADSGAISLNGAPVHIASPLDAQRLGIGIVHQELDLFPNLSVAENIVIGNLHFPECRWVRPARMRQFCRPFLDQVGLLADPSAPAAALSIGQRQLLVIARALSMDAHILLLDEPTSSLFDDAAERLFALIAALKLRGVSIVYVSHKMDEIFRLCDRATVMRDGATIATVDVASTTRDELIRLMVGRDLLPAQPSAPRSAPAPLLTEDAPLLSGDAPLLSATNLTTTKLKRVSFDLHRGEVLGVAGLVGSGRSSLGAALFGLSPITAGTVRLQVSQALPYFPRSPRQAIAAGIALLPEDRRIQGLMMRMSVLENATLAILPRLSRFGWIRRREHLALAPVFRRLVLQCPSLAAPVSQLSGGNQQKVLLARWLLSNPAILFLDDPTRGIDIGAKQDIYRLIEELAAAGAGVILVSSELPELLRCCHRIMVLHEGRVAAEYPAVEATQEKIMRAATNAAQPS
jgi:ribose transport system ATP-binding protein